MSDVYLIKYSGAVNTFMTTHQAYLGYGLATSALYGDKPAIAPAIAFETKAECVFFIQAHPFFVSTTMIPRLVNSTKRYKYEMFKSEEMDR